MPVSGGRMRGTCIFNMCVDEVSKSNFSGRLYHCYSAEAIAIAGPVQLFQVMDSVFDSIDFPQSSTQARTFTLKQKVPETERKGASLLMNAEEVSKKRGDKGTFVVHVRSRQNATWQGRLTWAEKDQSQSFRSALELLKLIDSAIDADDSRSKLKKGEQE